MMTMLQPLGIDRWAVDLELKDGIRDGLVCPVGGLAARVLVAPGPISVPLG